MKGFHCYLLKVLSLLVFAQISVAQTNLAIITSQTSYQFNGNGQEDIISFEFDNLGPDIASGGVTVTFTKDMFVDPNFNFTNTSSSSFNCTPNGDSINCNLINTSFDPNTPVFIDLGLLNQPGNADLAPAFSVNITDQSGQDSDLSNNNIFIDVEYITAGTDVDLQVVKTLASGFPSTVAPGDSLEFDITVSNLSLNQAFNVVLSDDLITNGLDFIQNGSSPECSDFSGTGIVQCTVSALAGGASQNFTIATVVNVSAQPGNKINVADVTSSENDTDINNNQDNQPFAVVLPGAEIAVSKTIDGGLTEVLQGDIVEYVIEVNNTGTANAVNVAISDTLPAGLAFDSFVETGTNFTCNYTAPTVSCNAPTLPNVASSDGVRISAVVVGAINSSINNSVTTPFVDNILFNNTDSVMFTVIGPEADLGLSMVADQANYAVGDLITLNLSVQSNANSTGMPVNTTVNTTLPNETIFSSAQVINATGWSCTHDGSATGGNVACNSQGNPIAIGGEVTIEMTAVADSETVSQATVSSSVTSDFDNNINNDFADAMFDIVAGNTDFTFTLKSVPKQVSQGENFKHRLNVSNSGNTDLTAVRAVYVVPQAAELLSFSTNGFSCERVSNTFDCSNDQALTVGASSNIDFNLVVNDYVGLISSRASVTADGTVKSADTSTQVISSAQNDLSLVKSASVTEIGQNEPFTYVLDVVNLGSETQTTFDLIDQLPSGVIFQSTSGNNWNCTGVSQLSCQYSGDLAVGGLAQLSINVLASNEVGIINNTATVNLEGDENSANNTSSASVNVVEGTGGGAARADLSVLVEVDNNNVVNTEMISWRIRVNNSGPDAAENVVIGSTLPVGFVAGNVQVMDGAECILLATSLVCEIDTLETGQSNEIILTGGFAGGFTGLLVNAVEVVSDTVDGNPVNNVANSEVNVTAVEDLNADLSLQLNANNQQVQQGGVVELSFNASNLGPDAAVNAQISGGVSGLIENIQFLSSGSWMCQVNNNAFNCSHPGDLQVGMQSEIGIRVQTQQVVQQSQPVVLNASITSDSIDGQPSNNMLTFTNEVTRTPSEDEIFAIFQDSVGSGASETVIQSIRNVSSYCARRYFTAIEGLCEEFIEDATPENGGAIINAMEELTPNEVAAQSNSAAEIITSQFRNVGSRLAQLRGGGGSGFSVAGLTGRYGDQSIPIGMLSYLNQGEGEEAVSNIDDFVSPWGFFVNGSISMGERDATGRELGFDFDTYGVTAGVDYRFSPTRVAGLALGYANFDSDIEGEAEMQSTSLTLTGYGSFYIKDNFYVDARISYGNPDFEQKRRINFVVDDIAIDRVASGTTDSNQYSVAMSAGYHFNKNAWNITPNASIRYVRTTIDAFQESGAGGFNFAFGEQEVKSLVWSVGASVSRAISLKNGVISPQFDFNLSRETENDGGLLAARFINAPDDEIFWIGTDEPDRTFGDAGVGFVFIGANGKQAYINYRSIFGLEGFTRGTINVGARFEF